VLLAEGAELLPAFRRVASAERPSDGVPELVARLDAHFDTLAELAERSAGRSSEDRRPAASEAPEREEQLRRAFEARGRRLVEQRLRLADEIEELERTLAARDARTTELEAQLSAGKARIAELETHFTALEEESAATKRRLAEVEAYAVSMAEDAAATRRRLADVEAYAAAVEEESARTKGELDRLLTSRTFRYTAPLRALYARIRRLVA
jgi:chromosome segregation ATPase